MILRCGLIPEKREWDKLLRSIPNILFQLSRRPQEEHRIPDWYGTTVGQHGYHPPTLRILHAQCSTGRC